MNKNYEKRIKEIGNKLLQENQDLKRTLELRDVEIQTLKDLIKIKQEEIYNLQAIIMEKECQK